MANVYKQMGRVKLFKSFCGISALRRVFYLGHGGVGVSCIYRVIVVELVVYRFLVGVGVTLLLCENACVEFRVFKNCRKSGDSLLLHTGFSKGIEDKELIRKLSLALCRL